MGTQYIRNVGCKGSKITNALTNSNHVTQGEENLWELCRVLVWACEPSLVEHTLMKQTGLLTMHKHYILFEEDLGVDTLQ